MAQHRCPGGGVGAGPMRAAAIAGALVALAAVGVVAGALAFSGGRATSLAPPAALPLAVRLMALAAAGAAAAAAFLLIRRLYIVPAARGVELLAPAAGHELGPHPSLEQVVPAAAKRHQRLQRRYRRLHTVVSELPQGVLVFRRNGRLREINLTGAVMLGVAADTGVASGPRLHAALAQYGLDTMVQAALRDGVGAESDLHVAEGDTRWLQAQSQPFTGPDATAGVLVVLRDVTRLRRLEHMRRDFVANVSHELRTPITSISGFVETLLDRQMFTGPEAERFLHIIQRQAARLGAIIDDLLSLSTIQLGEERRTIAFIDATLAPVIAAAVQSCQPAAAAQRVQIRTACPADLTCRVNEQLLEQAIANLVDNAIKYSPRGSVVTVSARGERQEAVVEVADSGIGIPDDHLPRIFERFYRVERARSSDPDATGGTGLGLAIVKHIAQAHGGAVRVTSTVNRGSTFSLHLPA